MWQYVKYRKLCKEKERKKCMMIFQSTIFGCIVEYSIITGCDDGSEPSVVSQDDFKDASRVYATDGGVTVAADAPITLTPRVCKL